MASFTELKKNNLIKTSLEGVYIKDVPLAKLREMEKIEKASKKSEDGLEVIAWMFQEIIRAEDGTVFEDALTTKDIESNLGIVQVRQIMEAVNEAMHNPGKS